MVAAVFLDRDGLINESRDDYAKAWEELCLLPGVLDALARLAGTPFRIVLVTNQPPIGRGILTQEQVETINRRLVERIEAAGGRIDGIYDCPHHPDEGCECQRPKPGLLLQAASELGLDLAQCYLIGDAVSDVEAALAAGCRPIFVLTRRGREQESLLRQRRFDRVPIARDLAEAFHLISDKGGRSSSTPSPSRRRARRSRVPRGVARLWSEWRVEILIVFLTALAVFLLVEQMQIRRTLLAWLRQGFGALKDLGEGLLRAAAGLVQSTTLSDLVGYALLLVAFVLVTWRVRRRLMTTPRLTMPRCPRCGGDLQRIHRRWRDRLATLYVPVRRYRCKHPDCGWTGLRTRSVGYKSRRHPRDR